MTREQERPPREIFRPQEASRTYASAAAVLAGFCFAAVVLVVSIEQGSNTLTTQGQLQAAIAARAEGSDVDTAGAAGAV